MKLEIAWITGDGVGPEMMAAALGVLKAVSRKYGHQLQLTEVLACGQSMEQTGSPITEEALQICKQADAVLLGNTGLAKYRDYAPEQRPEYALLKLRKELQVTTNIRPVRLQLSLAELSPLKEQLIAKGLDFVFVRDIVGGVLCSEKVKSTGVHGREAYEHEYYNEKMICDTASIAFELARKRKKKLISLDKANVLESSRLWRQSVTRMGVEYPDVMLSHCYIDTAAMDIIKAPWDFDVIVTSNIFGDIISDEGTQLTGAPCLYASAEISKKGVGLYTPNQIHYADESAIGKEIVCPIGMIAAVALMLRYSFGLEAEAGEIEAAVEAVLNQGYVTRDIWQEGSVLLKTSELGQKVIEEVEGL